MEDLDEKELFLERLFAPTTFQIYEKIQGKRFVHYTTAESALKIITGQQVWMRHASVMNDFLEIEYGANCLKAAWDAPAGDVFKDWLRTLFDGFLERLVTQHNADQLHLKNDTYLTSMSVHEGGAEDIYGRLSMWRAYGAPTGVALVVNPTAFMGRTEDLGAFSSPVIYQSPDAFVAWFETWATSLIAQTDFLKSLGEEEVFAYLIHAFRRILLCTKHPGFHEEQEWRVYHTPAFDGVGGHALIKSFETIRGVPQPVMKIPLDAKLGIPGLAVNELLDRVIIGPTEHSLPIFLAFCDALGNAGFSDPGSLVVTSDIPLRQ